MRTAGIDVGSLTAKAAILENNHLASWSMIFTGPDGIETAREVMNIALEKANLTLDSLDYIVATGYGRVRVPFAQRNVTEISCHAKGAHWFFPGARTILDMGGQDYKAIRCDEKGRVVRYAMSEKCAAGAGSAMGVMAELMGMPLAEMGPESLRPVNGEVLMNRVCPVIARSQALHLLRQGVPRNDILAGLFSALASRVYSTVLSVGIEEDFVINGGIAKNIGVVKRIEQKVGLKAKICFEPQSVGAVGAAVIAREMLEKLQK